MISFTHCSRCRGLPGAIRSIIHLFKPNPNELTLTPEDSSRTTNIMPDPRPYCSNCLFEMLLKSSPNADNRQAYDFLRFLVIPNHHAFSHVHSYGRSRLFKAKIESVCLSIIFPI